MQFSEIYDFPNTTEPFNSVTNVKSSNLENVTISIDSKITNLNHYQKNYFINEKS